MTNPGKFFLILVGTFPALLLGGCMRLFEQPPMPRTTYSFAIESPRRTAPADAPVLSVRLFDSAPLIENQEFVYRVAADRWETDFYHAFAQPPAVLLTQETRRWMQGSGLFRAVAIPGLAPADSWQLQGFLGQLYGDFQNPELPLAVISMRFALLPPYSRSGTNPVFTKHYEHKAPLRKASPAGLVDAWNRALTELLKQLTADIRTAMKNWQPPSQSPAPPASPAPSIPASVTSE